MKKLIIITLAVALMFTLTAFGSMAHDQGANGSDACIYEDGVCIVCEWIPCKVGFAPHEFVCINCGHDVSYGENGADFDDGDELPDGLPCKYYGDEVCIYECIVCGFARSEQSYGENGEDNGENGSDADDESDNPGTGIKLAIIPALLAGAVIAAVVIAKKRK